MNYTQKERIMTIFNYFLIKKKPLPGPIRNLQFFQIAGVYRQLGAEFHQTKILARAGSRQREDFGVLVFVAIDGTKPDFFTDGEQKSWSVNFFVFL